MGLSVFEKLETASTVQTTVFEEFCSSKKDVVAKVEVKIKFLLFKRE